MALLDPLLILLCPWVIFIIFFLYSLLVAGGVVGQKKPEKADTDEQKEKTSDAVDQVSSIMVES